MLSFGRELGVSACAPRVFPVCQSEQTTPHKIGCGQVMIRQNKLSFVSLCSRNVGQSLVGTVRCQTEVKNESCPVIVDVLKLGLHALLTVLRQPHAAVKVIHSRFSQFTTCSDIDWRVHLLNWQFTNSYINMSFIFVIDAKYFQGVGSYVMILSMYREGMTSAIVVSE